MKQQIVQRPVVSFTGQGRYDGGAEDMASAVAAISCLLALALFVAACFVVGGCS